LGCRPPFTLSLRIIDKSQIHFREWTVKALL
jgi:hypothetical protein